MKNGQIVKRKFFKLLGESGVRKYDYETDRFNSIDPLFEKYLGSQS
jgi:uncharacterized protein YfbU (UPF0304 family)